MTVSENTQSQERPSYEQPEECWIGPYGCKITIARYWTEDGKHIIVSEEFSAEGVGATFKDAAQSLGRSIESYWQHLAQVSEDDIAENELAQLQILARRYAPVLKIMEQEMTSSWFVKTIVRPVRPRSLNLKWKPIRPLTSKNLTINSPA